MIVGKTTIEKIISSTGKKMLHKCMSETRSFGDHQAIARIPIATKSPNDRGTNNQLVIAKRSRDI